MSSLKAYQAFKKNFKWWVILEINLWTILLDLAIPSLHIRDIFYRLMIKLRYKKVLRTSKLYMWVITVTANRGLVS